MTGGEKRTAQRLEAKLEDDYLLWYDVPIGPANSHPDFIVLHPQRGILILEVKDWKPDNIRSATKQSFELLTVSGIKHLINPLEQARQYAHAVSNLLQRDKELTINSGVKAGHLLFSWSYGVVFPNILRKTFEESGLDEVIEPSRVICQDEMFENVDPEEFQQRLWNMFTLKFPGKLSLPQLNRIRWHMFPEVRIATSSSLSLFQEEPQSEVIIPDLLRVMDLQQEQLARSLGEGHRVIHGVAGSGKTLILGYRAVHLAQVCTKPILILCYNNTLASKLRAVMAGKGLEAKVLVQTFHSWCSAQLRAYNVSFPKHHGNDNEFFSSMVDTIIRAADKKQVPSGQYDAVLIDEGHDFRPEWLKLVVQMVDPQSNSLLVLYDDAQSIYEHTKKQKFSFKSLGIQAQGRTTILKINYRNTKEILNVAASFAKELLSPIDADEDGMPIVQPMSAGRNGISPTLVNLPSLDEESMWIISQLKEENRTGTPWKDMAILYRSYYPVGQTVERRLKAAGIPVSSKKEVRFTDDQDTVKLITMHSSKGLEFPIVVIPDIGLMPDENCVSKEEVRLLYVAMTRATSRLMMTSHRNSLFTEKLQLAIGGE
ncbi:DNA helicase [Candidatus Nitrotoga sp. M5]|nr:DNA helicase [Candidatus Nitrotoga sp. M5]